MTWAELANLQEDTPAVGKHVDLTATKDESMMRMTMLCRDRLGVNKRVMFYNDARGFKGFKVGSKFRWVNPKNHVFEDDSQGFRIEEEDIKNITITDGRK